MLETIFQVLFFVGWIATLAWLVRQILTLREKK